MWGTRWRSSARRQSVDDLAAILETIPYELTCAVSKRVPRLYMENGKEIERSLRTAVSRHLTLRQAHRMTRGGTPEFCHRWYKFRCCVGE